MHAGPHLRLFPSEIPHRLREILETGAQYNAHYDPRNLHPRIASDIAAALRGKRGDEILSLHVRERNVDALRASLQARVRQIIAECERKDDVWKEKQRRGASPQDIRAATRSILKSLQEVFTHPADWVIFSKQNNDGKNPDATFPADRIVIDPARISDRLMEHLGLGDRIKKQRLSKCEKIEVKDRAIPLVKSALRYLEPLGAGLLPDQQKKKYRLFRITGGPKKGCILGVQNMHGEERIFITDLEGAEGRFKKIELGYTCEQKRFPHIRTCLRRINAILGNWQRRRSELRTLLTELADLIKSLEYVSHPDKRKLLDALRNAYRLLGQDRPNPGAARACINMLRINVIQSRRLQEIPEISAALEMDRRMLEHHREQEKTAVESVFIRTHKRQKRQLNLFNGSEFVSELADIRQNIRDVRFRPNTCFAAKIEAHLDPAIGALCQDPPDPSRAKVFYIKAYTASKLARISSHLSNIYQAFSLDGENGVKTDPMKKTLVSIEQAMNVCNVAPDVPVLEYEALCQEVKTMVIELRSLIEKYESDKTPAGRKNHIAAIKNRISSFDLPARVEAVQLME